MIFLLFYLCFIVSLVSNTVLAATYEIKLHCDEKVFQGASPDCQAGVYYDDQLATDKFDFKWSDNALPPHKYEDENTNATSSWRIPYKRDEMGPGWYVVRVNVCRWVVFSLFCQEIGSVGFTIIVTGQLNGQINITQQNLTRDFEFVSSNGTALHHVALDRADRDYVDKAPTVLSHWFVDCVYYGLGDNLSFPFNYTKPDESYMIETLVVADFTPLPPTTTVPPSTTTTKPTSTTTKPTTTTSKTTTTTTTKNPNSTSIPSKQKRSLDNKIHKSANLKTVVNGTKLDAQGGATGQNQTSNIKVWLNGTLVPYKGSFPFVCGNGAVVSPDDKKAYGYFKRNITVKAPVSNFTIKGNNWLQKGDLLDLQVKCQGSENMLYCLSFYKGIYNVTGNETCQKYLQLDVCEFPIKRYLSASFEKYTVLIIIKNDVSRVVTPVTVTIYQVIPPGQLFVIVVPVAFILMAVVLIVFGVAYYLQNRSRFVVEVADFDFGQQYSDMEYKTFRERLRDSVINAFTKDPIPSTSDVSAWPPGHKYGSMT